MKKRYDEYNLLILKALQFFIENPYEEVYLREFAKRLNISPNTAQRFLNLFLKEGIINEHRRANLRYFKSNLESLVFKYIKKTYSVKKLTDCSLIEHLKKNNFYQVALFGSLAKGMDDKKSDIDIVCIGNNKNVDVREFEKKLKKEINLHIFTQAEWKRQAKENKAFYQDVISTGINLIGEMPIIN